MSDTVIKRGLCGMCRSQCDIRAGVCDGKIVSLHPDSDSPRGRLCPRGALAREVIYGKDRLLTPLIRTGERGEGKFRTATWDEALDTVARGFETIRRESGPEALAGYFGQGALESSIRKAGREFFSQLGSPNFMGSGSICNVVSFVMAPITTLGIRKLHIRPDVEHSDVVFVWGKNPLTDDGTERAAERILAAKKRGAKLVVIDPRGMGMAEHADIWVPILPGSDGALVTAMLKALVDRKAWDGEMAEQYTHGFPRLVDYLAGLSEEELLGRCGISRPQFQAIMDLFCSSPRVCLFSYTGLEYQYSGVQNIRAIWILWALGGKLDVEGGMVLDSGPYPVSRPRFTFSNPGPIGSEDFPVFTALSGTGQFTRLPRAVIEGDPYPVKGLLIAGGSPIVTFPNSQAWRDAYSKLHCLVVLDRYMTEDAKYADVILPATTWYENASVCNRRGVDLYREPLIEPVGGAKNDIFILQAIAQRLGLKSTLPKNNEELYLWAVDGDQDKLERLRSSDRGQSTENPVRYRKYREGLLRADGQPGFPTPTGKLEICSTLLEEAGYEGLPVYRDIRDTLSAEGYPLMLTTGARSGVRIGSFGQNIPEMSKFEPVPYVDLSVSDAQAAGLRDGDMARVTTPFGQKDFTVRVGAMAPGTIHIPFGGGSSFMNEAWAAGNVNDLCSLDYCDPISGFAVIKSIPCRIEAARR